MDEAPTAEKLTRLAAAVVDGLGEEGPSPLLLGNIAESRPVQGVSISSLGVEKMGVDQGRTCEHPDYPATAKTPSAAEAWVACSACGKDVRRVETAQRVTRHGFQSYCCLCDLQYMRGYREGKLEAKM